MVVTVVHDKVSFRKVETMTFNFNVVRVSVPSRRNAFDPSKLTPIVASSARSYAVNRMFSEAAVLIDSSYMRRLAAHTQHYTKLKSKLM